MAIDTEKEKMFFNHDYPQRAFLISMYEDLGHDEYNRIYNEDVKHAWLWFYLAYH